MKAYHDLLQNVLDNGDVINTERTGVGTIATFGEQIKFDLRQGFPAITTKKLAWKAVVSELIWFLKGSANLYDLRAILHGEDHRFNDEKRTIWDGNYNSQAKDLGYENGFMGDIYGTQWRAFDKCEARTNPTHYETVTHGRSAGIDQVKLVIEEAKANPSSRRLIVSAWNPRVVWANEDPIIHTNPAALPPCHMLFQLNIVGDYIDLQWYQRSVDTFLGLPFNIASYGLLAHIFGRILNKTPRFLVGALGNTHIYQNHVDQVKLQLSREHLPAPELEINFNLKTLEDFENATTTDFLLRGYESHGPIKAEMAV